MSSAIIVSDLHAHAWSRFATVGPDGVNSRFRDLLDVLDQIEASIIARQPEFLLLLGDLTHRRGFVQFSTYTPIMQWILAMQERHSLHVIAIPGNHDVESRGVHSLGPLALAGVTVIDEPEWIRLGGIGRALFVPFIHDQDVGAVFREPPRAGYGHESGLAFCHYALDGTPLTSEYQLDSSLRLSDLEHFDRVIAGHVHQPNAIGKFQYTGAVMHFDFGDRGPRFAWHLTRVGQTVMMESISLSSPSFVTATYPRIPAAPERGGFLRVLNTPAPLFDDIEQQAVSIGWTACMPIEASMPEEAAQVLSSTMMVDADMLRDYVTRSYPEASETLQTEMVDFGLECLRRAQDA